MIVNELLTEIPDNFYKDMDNLLKESMNTKLDKSLFLLNEAYFQQGESMNKLLSLLKKIKDPMTKYKWNNKYFKKVSTSKPVLDFNREMEKFFGFKTFTLKIEMYEFWNAWTIPVSFKYDINSKSGANNIKKTPEGYKFTNNEYNVVMTITSSLMIEPSFNERDIMAIILHEMGHNFSFAIDNMGGMFGNICKTMNIISLVFGYINVWIVDNETRKTMPDNYYNEKDNALRKLADHITKQDNLFVNIAGCIAKPAAWILNIGVYMVMIYGGYLVEVIYKLILQHINPIELMVEIYGYNDEKVGDNFATMYGFGPELSKFNADIYKINAKAAKESPFIMKLISVMVYPLYVLLTIKDPHPRTSERILDQIKLLEAELDKEDLDPKMKAQIKSDIKNTKAELDKFYKAMETYDPKVKILFNDLMEELFGGDFRNIWVSGKDYTKGYDNVPE